MKKRITVAFISIFLIATLCCSSFVLTACKRNEKETSNYGQFVKDVEDPDVSIGVLSDIHVMSDAQAVDKANADFKAYESKGQKMLGLSESILKTAVDRIIEESDLEVVLVAGDNADDGGEVTHRAVAAELARLEKAGIKVFTIPGNHDINNRAYTYAGGKACLTNPTTESEFAEIYKDFGYNKSDVKEFFKNVGTDDLSNDVFNDGDNLSYVADLPGNYRLIAIDMSNHVMTNYLTDDSGEYSQMGLETDGEGRVLCDGEPYPYVRNRHDGAMTEELLLWARAKTEEAISDGKIPVGMMHFPLVSHFGPLIKAKNMLTNDPEGYYVADELADAGMRYIFTGHIHIEDVALYTSANGNKILDINSASLCNYPTPIRTFRAKGDDAYIRTWNMDRVKEEYLPSNLTAEEKAKILSDFRSYSVAYIDDSMLAKVRNTVDMDLMYTILDKFGIEKGGANSAEVDALATSLYNDVFLGFVKMPLYKKDAKEGQQSVQAIAEKYGVKIPSSDYTTVFNVAMSFASALYGGNESVSAKDTRYVLLKYAIFSVFEYLSDFDLFAKLHALNENVKLVDLTSTAEELFRTETLDVCSNNLLVGVVSSLDIPAIKKYLNFNENTNPYKALESVKTLVKTLDLGDLLGDLDLSQYIKASATQQVGYIRLGALMDDCFEGPILLCMANDFIEGHTVIDHLDGELDVAPSDTDLKISTKTMAFTALE